MCYDDAREARNTKSTDVNTEHFALIVDGDELEFCNLLKVAEWLDLTSDAEAEMQKAIKTSGKWEPTRSDVPAVLLIKTEE